MSDLEEKVIVGALGLVSGMVLGLVIYAIVSIATRLCSN